MVDHYYACSCSRCRDAYTKRNATYAQPLTPNGKATRPSRNRWVAPNAREAGVFLDFVNRVTDAIHEEFPDVYVHTFAYYWTRYPPDDWKPADRLIIDYEFLVDCQYHPLGQCPQNEEVYGFWTTLRGWTKKCPNVWVWDTAYNFQTTPAPIFKNRGLYYRELQIAGVDGVFVHMCGNNTPWMGDLRAHLYVKLLWNPDYDVFAGIAEYCKHAYGAASELMHRHYLEGQDPSNYGYEPPKGYDWVPGYHARGSYHKDEAVRRWGELLAAAEAAVQDDPESLERVRRQHEAHKRFAAQREKAKQQE